MSPMSPNAADNQVAGQLLELERQEKDLVFYLQGMFLENNYDKFDRAHEELKEVRHRIYNLLKPDVSVASDNKKLDV